MKKFIIACAALCSIAAVAADNANAQNSADITKPVVVETVITKSTPGLVTEQIEVNPQIRLDRPVLVDKQMTIDKPVLVEREVAVEKPVFVDKEIVIDNPKFVDKEIVIEKPKIVDKEIVIEVPKFVDKEIIVEKKVYVDKEIVIEKPVIVEKQIMVNKPVIVERPVYVEPVATTFNNDPMTVRQVTVSDAPMMVQQPAMGNVAGCPAPTAAVCPTPKPAACPVPAHRAMAVAPMAQVVVGCAHVAANPCLDNCTRCLKFPNDGVFRHRDGTICIAGEACTVCGLCSDCCIADPLCRWDFLDLGFLPRVPNGTVTGNTYGLKTGWPICTGSGLVMGIEASWLGSATAHIKGLQASGIYCQSRVMQGLEASLIANVNTEQLDGLQATGFFNYAGDVRGVQVSSVNMAKNITGWQWGVFYNQADESKAFQLALVNCAKKTGFQIGLLNFIEDGWLPFFPFINFSF